MKIIKDMCYVQDVKADFKRQYLDTLFDLNRKVIETREDYNLVKNSRSSSTPLLSDKEVIDNVKNLNGFIKKEINRVENKKRLTKRDSFIITKENMSDNFSIDSLVKKEKETNINLKFGERSKIFLSDMKSDASKIIEIMIHNNKDNDLFRLAWHDLIDEPTTEFEQSRLIRIRERIKNSKQNQEWRNIIVTSPDKNNIVVIDKLEVNDGSQNNQLSSSKNSGLSSLNGTRNKIYNQRIYDHKIISKQDESVKTISQYIENMMLDFSKNQNLAELQRQRKIIEKNKEFRLHKTTKRGGSIYDRCNPEL